MIIGKGVSRRLEFELGAWFLKGAVHENVMFSPDAVRSSERFTRAAPSTSGRAKSKFLSAKVKSCCSEGESPSGLGR